MRLVEKHRIKQSDKRYGILIKELHRSKNLYNATLYALRQEYFETEKYIPYAALQQRFQSEHNVDYYALPSKVAQWTMKMVDQNYRSFFRANEDYKKNPRKYKGKPSLPKYLDRDGKYVLTYTIQAISKKELERRGIIRLSGCGVEIKTKVKYNDVCCVRVVPMAVSVSVEIVYEVEDKKLLPNEGRYAAIDMGVDNLAAVASNINGFETFAVSGKPLKSYNHYYNKKRAMLKGIAEIRNKKKTTKRLQRLDEKHTAKMLDYMHKASRYIVNQLVSKGIDTLIIGCNKGWKQDINNGKENNQNFAGIPHYRLESMLCYKCAMAGITVLYQEESYTSKCSFLDFEEVTRHEKYLGRRVHRGLYKSSNGSLINADVNGALNILRKCKPKAFANGITGVVVHPWIIKIQN